MHSISQNSKNCWLIGKGTMYEAILRHDWSKTSLGPLENWPAPLRFSINNMLVSPLPRSVIWGEELLLFYNDANLKVIHKIVEQTMGKPVKEVWPDSWEFGKEFYERVFKYGESILLNDQEFNLINRDGLKEKFWFTIAYSPIYSLERVVSGINVSFVNVSERIKFEDSLRESNKKLEAAINSMTEAVGITNADGKFVEINDAFVAFHKFENKSQILPLLPHWMDTIEMLSPSGSVIPFDNLPRSRALRGESATSLEFIYRRKDTGVTWTAVVNFSPIRDGGNSIVGSVITARDITEKKQADEIIRKTSERLSLAVEAAEVGIWVWDLRTNALEWDDKMFKMFAIPPEKFTGAYEAWESAVHPDDLPTAKELLMRAVRGECDFNTVFRIIWPSDKSVHYIQANALVRKNELGEPIGMTGTNWDITKRKNLENELRSAIDIRDDFISIASHELKTPLTALHLQLQILQRIAQKESFNEKIAKIADAAFKSSKSMAELLSNLLDITRIRVGKLSLELRRLELRELLIRGVENFQIEAKQAGSTITLHAPEPIYGAWDENRIGQIMANLFSNAIKYGLGKPIEVRLIGSKDWAQIEVIDQGMGIASELQTKIFERFQRAVSGDKITGLGLGLYIVRQIVEAHHGTISLESELDKGSRFIVRLPLGHPSVGFLQ